MSGERTQRYEYVEGTSSKFWEIALEGASFATRWGRIGTDGQTKKKSFSSADKAQQEHDKLIAEKLSKGYQQSSGVTAKVGKNERTKKPEKRPPARAAAVRFPFPFFGAGEATYFEWVAVQVRFARLPSPREKKQLLANAPRPLSAEWSDLTLTLGGEPHAGARGIHRSYEADPGDRSGGKDGDGWFFSKDSQVRRFNEHIERWLIDAHGICPIVVALRREDSEADRRAGVVKGTQLSAWHAWSLKQLTVVLEQMSFGPNASYDASTTGLLQEILQMAITAKVKLTAAQRDFANPAARIGRARDSGDLAALRRLLTSERKATLEILAFPATPAKLLLAVASEILEGGDLTDQIVSALLSAAIKNKDNATYKRILTQARADPKIASGVADEAATRVARKQFTDALPLYDALLEIDDLNPDVYVPALWVLLKLPFNHARVRRYLARSLPHGPSNPAIFHNAACLHMKLGERRAVLEDFRNAVAHDYEELETMRDELRDEPLFKAVRKEPEFVTLFDPAKGKKGGRKR